MSAQVELWRVRTVDGVYEADLETLRQWIVEGAVLSTDKVCKGSLNWIDAGRAPMLRAAFNGEYVPAPPPEPVEEAAAEPTWEPESTSDDVASFESAEPAPADTASANETGLAEACYNHPGVTPDYICPACATGLCQACAKFLDIHRIATCPLCGEFCKVYEEVKAKAVSSEFQSSGFGFGDFVRAIRYPFQHKVALLFGALIYGLLLLGGLRGSVIAFVLVFGCMSHTISQVAWGRLNRSFMPDFSEFSLWDDLVCPIFLGIGIIIVTWGPVIALVVALFFGVVHAGPPISALGAGTAQHSSTPAPPDLDVLTDPEADPKKLEKANEQLGQLRPGAQIAQEAERSKNQQSDPTPAISMLLPLLGAGILFLVLFLLGIAWGIFYGPMALAVAGYTQSVGAVVNPMVGLDTIRRMGVTYFKAFGLVLAIQAVSFVVARVVAVITSPFALPFFGNLPATLIDGMFTFYFNLVIACLLGLSLYKCADRLGINVD